MISRRSVVTVDIVLCALGRALQRFLQILDELDSLRHLLHSLVRLKYQRNVQSDCAFDSNRFLGEHLSQLSLQLPVYNLTRLSKRLHIVSNVLVLGFRGELQRAHSTQRLGASQTKGGDGLTAVFRADTRVRLCRSSCFFLYIHQQMSVNYCYISAIHLSARLSVTAR